MKIKIIALVILVCLLLGGCESNDNKATSSATPTAAFDDMFYNREPFISIDSYEEFERLGDFLFHGLEEVNVNIYHSGVQPFPAQHKEAFKRTFEKNGYPAFDKDKYPDTFYSEIKLPYLDLINCYDMLYFYGDTRYRIRYYLKDHYPNYASVDVNSPLSQKYEVDIDGYKVKMYRVEYDTQNGTHEVIAGRINISDEYLLSVLVDHAKHEDKIEFNEISFEGLHLK